jgi:hypothetical protein
VLSASEVSEEWLFAWPHGRKQVWFERTGTTFEWGKSLHGENETIRGLTRKNSLFLSAAAQNNHAMLGPIFRWFRFQVRYGRGRQLTISRFAPGFDLIELFSPQLDLPGLAEAQQRDRDAIVRLLQAADTGIVALRVDAQDNSDRGTGKRYSMHFQHRTNDEHAAWLPTEAESDGTLTLLDMSWRLLRALREGGLLCVDELEASLHPMLALELVRMFNDPKHNLHGAQLIFTTHDTNLLGSTVGEPPLRRDQVWFTEKDASGASKLYALTEFHPRASENLERGYLQGRYGAVPFLGEPLVAENAEAKEKK